MRRFITLLFIACVCALGTFAQEISAEKSLQKAVEMISGKNYAKQIRGKADFALVHTERSVSDGKALYYVFSNERNGGFVITAADSRANSILGYTENGTYEQALEIPAFRSWIEGCQEAMQWLSNNTAEVKTGKCTQFDVPDRVVTNASKTFRMTIPGRQYTMDATLPSRVEPLLGDITWNQGKPYNNMCPEITVDGKTERCATGCVATAIAQIMKYHEWPKQGAGYHSYTSDGGVKVYLEADFSKSVYDWKNMISDYKGDYTEEQANAVAKLMSDVGISVDMGYGISSGASHYDATYALATYFGYNKGNQLCDREYYSHAEWNNLLKKELNEAGPVLIGARNMYENAGHQFVLDGYDEDGKYHVNWGWGGLSNGYYDINFLNPDLQGTGGSRYGYPAKQTISINLFPDKEGTSEAHPMIVVQNEVDMYNDTLYCQIANLGLATYLGKVGFVAYIDGEIVGSYLLDVTEESNMAYNYNVSMNIPLEYLGITPELIGDKLCYVYPVCLDGSDYKVPLSKVAIQDHVILGLDEDGKIANFILTKDNTCPTCEKIEITRDYAGYNVKGRAVISNKENCPTFDRVIYMAIYDEEGYIMAIGTNFAFIDAGESAQLEFCCNPINNNVLKQGETYSVELVYGAHGTDMFIPGGETTFTMRNPGPLPEISFSNFKLDKTVVAQNEEITISFDVENTGGFGTQDFSIDIYRKEGSHGIVEYNMSDTDIPNGKTKITATKKMDFAEGEYFINIFNGADVDSKINPEKLFFTIKNQETAISNVTGFSNASNFYYDLQGRRVVTPAKGIYIKDGKKIVK